MFLFNKLKQIIFSSLLLKILLVFASCSQVSYTFTQDAGLEAQNLESLEQELERIKNLPPEEQEQIYQDMYQEVMSTLTPEERAEVEAATAKLMEKVEAIGGEEVLNQMSPEELEKFFAEAFQEEQPQPETTVVPETKQETPKEEVKKISSKHEQALVIVDSIIEHSQSLIKKAKSIPEVSELVQNWTKKKKITQWEPALNWEKIKTNIEIFVQKLEKIKDRDPRTKAFKYLDDLIEDKLLYENLTNLQVELKKHESLIDVDSFGLKKVGKSSKVALQKSISSFTDALEKNKTTQGLDKIFEKYEPKAKQLREKEEAAKIKAEAEAKKPAARGPQVRAGVADQPGTGYSSFSTSGNRQLGGGYQAPYQPTSSPAGSGAKSTRPEQPTAARKAPAKDTSDSKGKTSETKEDEKIIKLFDEIRIDVSKVESLVERNNTLINIKTHVEDVAQPVDPNLNMRIIIRKIDNPKGGIIQSIEGLKKKVANASPDKKQEYKKMLQDIYNKNADTLDEVAQQIKTIKSNTVPADKKAAYVDSTPYSLYDLQKAIDKLSATIDKFAPARK